jgi:broad specificity phosphatase PhoE
MTTRRRLLRACSVLAVALASLTRGALAETAPAPTPPATAAAEAPITVVLLRHAEKQAGDDPSLNDAGRARAEALVRTLADAHVGAIFVTPPLRTRETAAPLVRATGVEAKIVPVGDGYATNQANLLRELAPGTVAVVVSHSNTVPAILAALGVESPPPIAEDRFDDLFVATVPADGPPTVLHLRYGAPSGG